MRSLYALALAAALALPHVAHAQTPSVTPTLVPHTVTFRFDCDDVPWSCNDGPADFRWQLYELVGCHGSGIENCRLVHLGPIAPNQTIVLQPGRNFKLYLGPNRDRSDRAGRTCGVPRSPNTTYMAFHSVCAVNPAACAGPENWQLYSGTDGALTHRHKHITDCSQAQLWFGVGTNWVLDWGLPGELSAAPTAAATMTAPPPATATVAPTVGIPTEAPTLTVAPTATDAPTATSSPPATRTATATPARAALLLPMAWR